MNSAAMKLLEDALALPVEERRKLTEALLDALPPETADELESAWLEEARRRADAVERAASGITDRELELASKLLNTLHLNVAERQELPSGRIRLSALVAAARADLAKGSFLPARLRPTDEFHGTLLEYRDDKYWIHQRFEVGVARYSPTVSQACKNLEAAVLKYVDTLGGSQIDGVPIDRST